jgi:hypothetical protein
VHAPGLFFFHTPHATHTTAYAKDTGSNRELLHTFVTHRKRLRYSKKKFVRARLVIADFLVVVVVTSEDVFCCVPVHGQHRELLLPGFR